jgi:hypothetical protein
MRLDDTVNVTRGNKDVNEAFIFIDGVPERNALSRNGFMIFAIDLCYSCEGI